MQHNFKGLRMDKFLTLIDFCSLDNTTLSVATLDNVKGDVIVQIRVSSSQARKDSTDFDYLAAQMVKTMCSLGDDNSIGQLGQWLKDGICTCFDHPFTFGKFSSNTQTTLPIKTFTCYINKSHDIFDEHAVQNLTLTVFIDADVVDCDDLDCTAIDGIFA